MSERLLEVESTNSQGHREHFYIPYVSHLSQLHFVLSTSILNKWFISYCSDTTNWLLQSAPFLQQKVSRVFSTASNSKPWATLSVLGNVFSVCLSTDMSQFEFVADQYQLLSDNFELASLPTTSPEERKRLLSFVVCGGGPTGVETAAEIYDFCQEDIVNYVWHSLLLHLPSWLQDIQIYHNSTPRYAGMRSLSTSSRVANIFWTPWVIFDYMFSSDSIKNNVTTSFI